MRAAAAAAAVPPARPDWVVSDGLTPYPEALREMIRACEAPVVVETPRAGHEADLAFVREAVGR